MWRWRWWAGRWSVISDQGSERQARRGGTRDVGTGLGTQGRREVAGVCVAGVGLVAWLGGRSRVCVHCGRKGGTICAGMLFGWCSSRIDSHSRSRVVCFAAFSTVSLCFAIQVTKVGLEEGEDTRNTFRFARVSATRKLQTRLSVIPSFPINSLSSRLMIKTTSSARPLDP
jgi:hypothetical protein